MKSMPGIDLSQPKLPPQNVEAEQSVLGAILLDNQAMAKAMELVVEENFYRTAHRKIYRAMLELSETGEVIDHITLTERLQPPGRRAASTRKDTEATRLPRCYTIPSVSSDDQQQS